MLAIVGMLLLPFVYGFFARGYYEIRHLVAVPILFSGLLMLGFQGEMKIARILITLLSVFCIFQFLRADNHLSGLSHIALQADRSLATRLNDRIEKVRTSVDDTKKIKYIEIIGIPYLHNDEFENRYDTLGSSFFEWDQGNTTRALQFMSTLGLNSLSPLPIENRQDFIEAASSMPEWPIENSVQIFEDVILVKLSPYSRTQKQVICTTMDKYAEDLSSINSCVINEFK